MRPHGIVGLFILALALSATAAEPPRNVWPNPSLEEGTANEMAGWERPGKGGKVELDTKSFHHGRRSLKLSRGALRSEPVTIDPRRDYFFSCWIRRNQDAGVSLAQCDAKGQVIEGAPRLPTNPRLRNAVRYWLKQTRVITPGDLHPHTRSLRLIADPQRTTLWLDDIALYESGPHDLPPAGAAYDKETNAFYRQRQVLLHVSFDRGGDALDADYAAGDPSVIQDGRPALAGLKLVPGVKGLGAHFTGGRNILGYAGPRNFSHAQGTISFWIAGNWNRLKKDPFTQRTIVTVLSNEGYQTQRGTILQISGGQPGKPIRFEVSGYDWQRRGVTDAATALVKEAGQWSPGEWHHLAFTWSRAGGAAAHLDGRLASRSAKPVVRGASIMANWIKFGTGRKGRPHPDMMIDEFAIFSQPLTDEQIGILADRKRGLASLAPVPRVEEPGLEAVRAARAREYGLDNIDALPAIPPASQDDTGAIIRTVQIARVTDRWKGFRFSHTAADNKRHTRTFTREPKRELYLNLVQPEPVNALMVMGNLIQASVHAGSQPTDRALCAAKDAVFMRWKGEPFLADRILIYKTKDSAVNEAALFHITPQEKIATPVQVLTLWPEPADVWKWLASVSDLIQPHSAEPDRAVVELSERRQRPSRVRLASMQALHLTGPPLAEDLAMTGFELILDMTCSVDKTAVNVRLRDPVYPRRTLVDADLCLTGAARARYRLVFDHADTIVAAGTRLWWELAFRDGATLATEGTRLVLHRGEVEAAKQAFVPTLLRRALDIYSAMTEPHQWDYKPVDNSHSSFRELFDCIREILRFDPANEVARAMWVRMRKIPVQVDVAQFLPGDDSAPEWARLQTALLEQTRQVIHKWCDRQGPDGRFTDNFGDDAELPAQWPYYPLVTGDEKSALSMERSADAYWHHPKITNGYINIPQDAIHNAEYTPVAECPLLFVRYGDPFHVERLMQIASNMPHWMGRTKIGHLHFRSSWVMADGKIDVSNRRNYDEGACARIAAPTWCVAYYNNNPTARQIVVDWSRAWVEDFLAERDGKPANVLPARIYFPDDRFEGHHVGRFGKWMTPFFYESYLFTGDKFFFRGYGRKGDNRRFAKMKGEWRNADLRADYVRSLTESLKRVSWEKHLYIHADPSTDRVYLPSHDVESMTLGGFGAPHEGKLVSRIAASYEGTGLDVAPLVLEDTNEHLLVAVYNFADGPRDIGVRVWELNPGTYQLTIGPDKDRNDRIDQPTQARRIPVRRYTRVPVSVPAKALYLVELSLVTARKIALHLPDPALSPRTTTYDRATRTLRVTVHNIGSAPVRGAIVVVENAQGAAVATKDVDAIEAPLDLKPRRRALTFPLAQKPARVRLEFEGDEITDVNNRVAVR